MYYHYGDWVPPPPHGRTNESLTSAVSYAIDVKHLAELADHLNMPDDHQKYQALYTQIGIDFHNAFYKPTINGYADGSQSANTLAFAIDAIPANLQPVVAKSLVDNIVKFGNHFTTGILGIRYLFEVLTNLNQHDLAITILSEISYPSYGYTFNNPYENATTLWELWDAPLEGPGMNSRNHIMYGSVGSFFL